MTTSTSTIIRSVAAKVVADSIDLSGYDNGETLQSVYNSEYGRNGLSPKSCYNYLQGLPSVCKIPFSNYDILQLLKAEGIDIDSMDDDGAFDLIEAYWKACSLALYTLLTSSTK